MAFSPTACPTGFNSMDHRSHGMDVTQYSISECLQRVSSSGFPGQSSNSARQHQSISQPRGQQQFRFYESRGPRQPQQRVSRAEQQFGAAAPVDISASGPAAIQILSNEIRSPSATCAYQGVVYTRLGYTRLLPSGDSLGMHSSGLLVIHAVCGCELIGGLHLWKVH